MTAPPPLSPSLPLTAVVVTFNRLAQLQRTLARLLDHPPGVLARVLVVDNAGTDGTDLWLAAQTDPRLEVVRLPANLGGAGGFEAGLRHVLDRPKTGGPKTGGPKTGEPETDWPETEWPETTWIVLMDDDARPEPGALAGFAPPAGAGAAAAAVFLPGGSVCEMNRVSKNPFWHPGTFLRALTRGGRRGFHLADADFAPEAPPQWIDVASFVGFFVSRQAVAAAGLPDGGLYIYGDDVLYSLRLRRRGVRMAFLPQVRFEHDCGTLGPAWSYRPLWKIFYHSRNGVGIARAAAGPLVFPLALAWYLVLWSRRARAVPACERAAYRRLMWLGVRHGLARRKGRFEPAHRIAEEAVEQGRIQGPTQGL
jgi:GT2 family glycosyltransferase